MNGLEPREPTSLVKTRKILVSDSVTVAFRTERKKWSSVLLYLFGSFCLYTPKTAIGDMDLQLGLGVSRNSAKGFDLNFSEIDFKEQHCKIKKRSFDEAFEEKIADNEDYIICDQTLPLLSWNDQPNQDDLDRSSMLMINKTERDGGGLNGWPPINPWRKRICHQNRRGNININCVGVDNGGRGGNGTRAGNNRGKNSMFVKVKMEGFGIARKVDLCLHDSHDSLLKTLMAMFGKCQGSFHSYMLTFQDKEEGDWQIVDIVPWRVFIESVQRLKLQRKKE